MIKTKPEPTKRLSIYSDIFHLACTSARTGNSIVAVLLYGICPVAARLYLLGKSPKEVYDSVVHALLDHCNGYSWQHAIYASGLESGLPELERYVARIGARRQRIPHMDLEAELDLLWEREDAVRYLFGLQSVMDKFGGSWHAVMEYVRTTAFLVPEWEAAMQIQPSSTRRLTLRWVVLSMPGLTDAQDIEYPIWSWTAQTEHGKRIHIGLLEAANSHNWLRHALVTTSKLADVELWPGGSPNLFDIDRHTGAVCQQTVIEPTVAIDVAKDIYHNICNGSCHAQAHYDINVCLYACGYRHICLDEDFPREWPKPERKETEYIKQKRLESSEKKKSKSVMAEH